MFGFRLLQPHRNALLRGVACLAIVVASGEAMAQIALPGVVVEGATLSKPDPAPSAPQGSAQAAGAETGFSDDGQEGGYPADSIGSSVSVVTSAELERRQIRHAAEALRGLPGVFCAGEMLDWEAPTGGYLLTACLASGRWSGQGAVRWLAQRAPGPIAGA